MTLSLAFLINVLALIAIPSLWFYFYLKYRNIKMLLAGAVLVSQIGTGINVFSYFAGSTVFNFSLSFLEIICTGLFGCFGFEWLLPVIIFPGSIFLISFLLLALMYYLVIYKVLEIESRKNRYLSPIILAILTNPLWVLGPTLFRVLFRS